ncbi:MAG: ABC transporter ATP-binding protein [Sphaerochaetaceae bacterium]|nr:ABC transporter ATP-binding protein [Sphaerochaetaceae bacterium]
MSNIIELKNILKTYPLPDSKDKLTIINDLSLQIQKGISVSIIGRSGCGKSTLLQIAASLLKPTSGEVIFNNKQINKLSDKQLCKIRNSQMGFIFQNSLLLEDFTAFENVLMPLLINGLNKKDATVRANYFLKKVSLFDRATHKPSQLSGGEKQRIALARALSTNPKVIFADEPTGSLDEDNATFVEDLLINLVKEEHSTLILVTHNKNFASKCNRTLKLTHGQITEDISE